MTGGCPINANPHVIPFEFYGNLIFLSIRLNGSQPLSFLLDTGATNDVLSETLADSLNLKTNEWSASDTSGIGEDRIQWGPAKSVTFGLNGFDFSGKPNWKPLSGSECRLGRPIDGLLGYPLFEHYVVVIDYETRKITLVSPTDYEYTGGGEIFSIDLSNQIPVVMASITPLGSKPIEGLFKIDTGAACSVNLNAPFVKEHGLRSSSVRTLWAPNWGVGGEAPAWLGRLNELQLGKFTFTQPTARFSTATNGAAANPTYAGTVGSEVLRRFSVTFDYSRKRMILEPLAILDDPFEADTCGASLITEEGKFKVVDVLDESPASEAGMQKGDLILTIDDGPASDLTLEHVAQLFEKQNKEYVLGVQRGDNVVQIKIKTRKLI